MNGLKHSVCISLNLAQKNTKRYLISLGYHETEWQDVSAKIFLKILRKKMWMKSIDYKQCCHRIEINPCLGICNGTIERRFTRGPLFTRQSGSALYVCVKWLRTGASRTRYRPRFFDQVGHQTTSAYIENKQFFTKSCHRQTYQNYEQPPQSLQNLYFQSHFLASKINRIFLIFFSVKNIWLGDQLL